jgi:hypothetical protein
MAGDKAKRGGLWSSLHTVTKVLVFATFVQFALAVIDLVQPVTQAVQSLIGGGEEDGAKLNLSFVLEVIRRLVWPLFNLGAIATVEFLARILKELKAKNNH